MPSEIDWARLAAYIDGEGSIFIRQRPQSAKDKARGASRGHYLVLCVVNCDPRLITWCKETFGGGCAYQSKPDSPAVGAKYQRPRRAQFQWIIGQQKAAHIIDKCMPYFILKREQAEVALAFQKTVSHRGNTRWKGGVSPELYEHREELRLELQRLKHVSFENESEHHSRVRTLKRSKAASALLFDFESDTLM